MRKLIVLALLMTACGPHTPRRYPGALVKHGGKVYHGCIVYTFNGGMRIRVDDGKQVILMGELTAEDDPDYYCMNDSKGPHPK